MSVKSLVDNSSKPLSFPRLMKSINSNAIVLFEEECTGVVVAGKTRGGHTVGYVYPNWNINQFEPFHGSVTLQNE